MSSMFVMRLNLKLKMVFEVDSAIRCGMGPCLNKVPHNAPVSPISHGSKFRGPPLTTLPVVLNKDLTRVSDDKLQLTSLKDLEHLRSVAQNRQTWRKLTTRIREAAEASPSDD